MPIYDQFENLIRLGIAFVTLFVLLNTLIFHEEGEGGERFFSRYVKMVLLVIIGGYGFVIIKLYEMISLFTMIALFSIFWRMPSGKRLQTLKARSSLIGIIFYETLDGNFSLGDWIKQKIKKKREVLYKSFVSMIKDPYNLLLLIVIGGATYLRFYDTLSSAAPGMSDAAVTLAWMKYISQRILFYDGIYPQGFHIYLATLQKFAGSDPIYILKYVGSFNGVFTTITLYYFTYKLTNSKSTGIITAFVFGILSPFLPGEWARQASTNSQEFALAFIPLCWLFTIQYLQTKEKRYLWTAATAFSVTGLTHSLIYGLMAAGVVFIILTYFVFGIRKNFRAVYHLAAAGVVSGIISSIPMIIGLVMKKPFHGSSAEYLTASSVVTYIPRLNYIDYAAIICIGLIFLLLVLHRWLKERPEPLVFLILFSSFALFSYLYLGVITGSTLISSRIYLLWMMVICIVIGAGWYALVTSFRIILFKPLEWTLCLALLISATVYYKPTPSMPYKMLHDSMINQYIAISKEFTPTDWMMISNEEGYAIAFGKGWHMQLYNFIDDYSPRTGKLVNQANPQEIIETENILILEEKVVFEPPLSIVKPLVEKRTEYYQKLREWVEVYNQYHDNLTIYYEDENLRVYYIYQPEKKEFNKIWNIKSLEDNKR